MRQALRANPQKKPPTFTVQEEAPVGGWTSQESFAEAEEGTAVILTNMFPEADAIRARRGTTEHATGLGADVTSLLRFVSATASKLFGAIDDKVYDVTASGAVGAAVLSGLDNGYWQQVMFATSAGQFLVMCNGADGVRTFDGAAWVDQTASITGTSGAATSFINVTAHKKRLWFVASGSTDLWYLATEAITGAAAKFPLGAVFRKGGYVMGMGTFSVDSGDGVDDLFVVESSEGELAVYQGTDPASSNTWQLVGVYPHGDPMGRRSLFQVGGDLLIIAEQGILPMSQAIKIDKAVAGEKSITKKIRQAYVDAVKRARDLPGWEIVTSPHHNMALCNVPAAGSKPTQQFAYNTITGAWALFTGLNAFCWAEFDGKLYYGSEGNVLRAEYGPNDNGVPIPCAMLPAFSHLKSPGRLKEVKDFRYYISTDLLDTSYEVAVAVDYQEPSSTSGAGAVASGDYFTWDVSSWDDETWYSERMLQEWTGAANIGTVVSDYFRMNLDAGVAPDFKFRILAKDYIYEPGGVL